MTELLAYFGCLILIALSVFQCTLIAGAPMGKYAWGGRHEVLPARLRAASFTSIVIYVCFAAVLLIKADVMAAGSNNGFIGAAVWFLAGYFVVGIFLNAASRSKRERMVMTPVALLLAVVFVMVAAS